jgi:hypothetical protein
MAPRVEKIKRTTLSRVACLDLLRASDLARVVISVRCLPAALPARIALVDDNHLLLASTEEAVIVAAHRGEVLSVQIDGLESDGATWSVMASGIAKTASDAETPPEPLRRALSHGSRLVELPLSVVVGEKVG